MLRRATARSKPSPSTQQAQPQQAHQQAHPQQQQQQPQQQTQPLPTPAFQNPSSDELIQRTRLKIPNAHVFKLPPKPHAGGWRGADWRDKVWQGTLKVVERGDETAVLLVDAQEERNIFAVCPIVHFAESNGVDRCIDSSRYFVLRIQNAQGRHMFIGLAFNERNDAFDFNTALEDSRREKEVERQVAKGVGVSAVGKSVDYKMKEGEKIRVSIPKFPKEDDGNSPSAAEGENGSSSTSSGGGAAARRREAKKTGSARSGGFLAPSSKDTPSRLA
ncbi:hypothetical protein ACHAWX_001069 [Stephanocyclus meneghinianus]